MNEFETRLRDGGMSHPGAAAKGAVFERLMSHLHEFCGAKIEKHFTGFVPGRLEFLGKHTDYAGGRSLLCAVEHGICLVAASRADSLVRLLDVSRNSDAHFALSPDLAPDCDHWSKFPATVARRIARDFPAARTGADIVFGSDLPRASGMSSSSALIAAVFFALSEINSLSQSVAYQSCIQRREDLAGYLAAIESGRNFATFSSNRGVGTFGGSEDHVAILCSRVGFLRQYSFCPIRLEKEIRVPEGFQFVIGVSGVKADKTGNAREAYNGLSRTTARILELWCRATGRNDNSLGAALSSGPCAGERLCQILSEANDPKFSSDLLQWRLAQFAEESHHIIPATAEALARGDLKSVGELVDRSQSLAETRLGNQTPETIYLAQSARRLGAVASTAFGAGFGGSVWSLVSSASAEEFCGAWALSYRERYPDLAEASKFFLTAAGPGLIQL
jgi:galactokinase